MHIHLYNWQAPHDRQDIPPWPYTCPDKYILQLPKNLEAIFVPESRTFSGKFGEFTVTSNYDKVENKIEYSAKTEIKTNQISPEDYKILKSNYEQFTNDENSILILKNK